MKFFIHFILVLSAISLITTQVNAQGSGSNCKLNPSCGGVGGGGGSSECIGNWPLNGKMIKEVVYLTWGEVMNAESYTLTIEDQSSILAIDTVFTITTSDHYIYLDLHQLNLVEDKEYTIQLSSSNGINGNPSVFTLHPAQDYYNDVAAFFTDNDLSNKTDLDVRLAKANFLASKSWNYAAIREHKLDEKMDFISLSKTMKNIWALIDQWEPIPE